MKLKKGSIVMNKNKNIKNIIIPIMVAVILCFSLLSACGAKNSGNTENSGNASTMEVASVQDTDAAEDETGENVIANTSDIFKSSDDTSAVDLSKAYSVVLNSTSISFNGTGAEVKGSIITIKSEGTYNISGTLSNGQIIVDAGDDADVVLLLNGVDITCTTSAPIYIKSSDKTIIALATGMKNHLSDGASYIIEDTAINEPNATVFSKSDLTINGNGQLTIDAKYNNAINCKDALKITSGDITVNSVDDGIKGKDCVAIKGASITVNAGGDGIQASNAEDAAKGYVFIEGNTITITSGADAIQAETNVTVNGGKLTLCSGGGSANSINKSQNQFGGGYSSNTDTTAISTKGIKATGNVIINGGTINIDSADDAVHSNDNLTIGGGKISISSGDDGIHSDTSLTINDGEISIGKSYEGIESAAITINDGNINIVASDDGINAAGGNDGSSVNGRPGQNGFSLGSSCNLAVNGGYIVVDGNGDGIDINGSITMTAGTLIINGPTANDNGALDYDSTCKVTGGTILAIGSSGMALAPDSSSTVYSVKINFTSVIKAGTMVHIETEDGENVLTFVPAKNYQSVVLCSSALIKGATYNVYTGGTSTGTVKDALYSGGTYSGGTIYTSFKVTSEVTSLGSSGGMGGGGRP